MGLGGLLGGIVNAGTSILGGFKANRDAKQLADNYDEVQLGSYGALTDANRKNYQAQVGKTVKTKVRMRDKNGKTILGKDGRPRYREVSTRQKGAIGKVTDIGQETARNIENLGLRSLGQQQGYLTAGESGSADIAMRGLNNVRNAQISGLDQNRGVIRDNFNQQLNILNDTRNSENRNINDIRNLTVDSYNKQSDVLRNANKLETNYGRDALSQMKSGANDIRSSYSPYLQSGRDAQGALSDLTGLNGQVAQNAALTNSPAYQFRLGEGTNAIQRSAAAQGGLFGGATGKALNKFGQGLASEEFGNQWNRVNDMATRGQNAATNYASQMQDARAGIANAQNNLGGIARDYGISKMGLQNNKYQGLIGNEAMQTDSARRYGGANQQLTQQLNNQLMNNTSEKSNAMSNYYTNSSGVRANEQQKLAEIYARMSQNRGNLRTGTQQQLGTLGANEINGILQAQMGHNTNKGNIDYNLYQALGRGSQAEMQAKDAAQGQMFQGGMGLLTSAVGAGMNAWGGGGGLTPQSSLAPQNSMMPQYQQGFGQQVSMPYYQQQNYGSGFYG